MENDAKCKPYLITVTVTFSINENKYNEKKIINKTHISIKKTQETW